MLLANYYRYIKTYTMYIYKEYNNTLLNVFIM